MAKEIERSQEEILEEQQEQFVEALERADVEEINEIYEQMHPIDLAEAMEDWDEDLLEQLCRISDDETIAEILEEAEEELLGATVEEDGTVINNADDESPYVQVGYIAARQKGGKKQYRGVVYTRVQFSVPNETANTKGETITFTTPVLTGTLTRDKNGDWRRKSKWSELEEANTWLDSFMTKNA